jgi:hypothetical protein
VKSPGALKLKTSVTFILFLKDSETSSETKIVLI